MDSSTDSKLQTLMSRAQGGDREAYGELMQEVASQIRGYVSSRVPLESVDDVVQETLITLHKARATYDASYPFGPWLYALTQFRIKDLKRRQWRRQRLGEVLEHMGIATTASSQTDDLREAFSSLPERQQQILALHKVAGYSLQEVANTLSISVGAAKVAASRAYKKLKDNFEGKADGN